VERCASLRPDNLLALSEQLHTIAHEQIDEIGRIKRSASLLSINAMIASAQLGDSGRHFAGVAREFRAIATQIDGVASTLDGRFRRTLDDLASQGRASLNDLRGQTLASLAQSAVEIIDRSLHDRTCDVRWWATDPAIIACADTASPELARLAGQRLGRILDTYSAYLDLWICDVRGRVLATGRPDRFPMSSDLCVAGKAWFQEALKVPAADAFVTCDVERVRALNDAPVTTWATAIRSGDPGRGKVVGVLGVHFDWQPQAQAIIRAIRLPPEDQARSRLMLLSAGGRVLAASDGQGLLTETFRLDTSKGPVGSYVEGNRAIGYALTSGLEGDKGLGWYGCLVQTRRSPAETATDRARSAS